MTTTAAAALAALALLLAGCGSGDTDDTGDSGDSANDRSGRTDQRPETTATVEAEGPEARDLHEAPDASTTEPPPDEPSEDPPPDARSSDAGGLGDAADVDACLDLDCEITVTEGMEIPADGEVGITSVTFEQIDPETVEIVATGPGIRLGCGGTPGLCTLNGVEINVTDVHGNTATVSFSR